MLAGSRLERLALGSNLSPDGEEPDEDHMLFWPSVYDVSFNDQDGLWLEPGPPGFAKVRAHPNLIANDVRQNLITDEKFLSPEKLVLSINERIQNKDGQRLGVVDEGRVIRKGPANIYKRGYTDYDLVSTVVCREPFPEMQTFKTRTRGSNIWGETVPLHELCSMLGLLVSMFDKCSPVEEWPLQFRKSFSHQEIILLRSFPEWILQAARAFKYIIKSTEIMPQWEKEDSESDLASYHCKTVLMWVVEGMTDADWETASPARLLLTLLSHLEQAVRDGKLSSYWVEESNLLSAVPVRRLRSIQQAISNAKQNLFRVILEDPEDVEDVLGNTELLWTKLFGSAKIVALMAGDWQGGEILAGALAVWLETFGRQERPEERGYTISIMMLMKADDVSSAICRVMDVLCNDGFPTAAAGLAAGCAVWAVHKIVKPHRQPVTMCQTVPRIVLCFLDRALSHLSRRQVLNLLATPWHLDQHKAENVSLVRSRRMLYDLLSGNSCFLNATSEGGPSLQASGDAWLLSHIVEPSHGHQCYSCTRQPCEPHFTKGNAQQGLPVTRQFEDRCALYERSRVWLPYCRLDGEAVEHPAFSSTMARLISQLLWSRDTLEQQEALAREGFCYNANMSTNFVFCFCCGATVNTHKPNNTKRHEDWCYFKL